MVQKSKTILESIPDFTPIPIPLIHFIPSTPLPIGKHFY